VIKVISVFSVKKEIINAMEKMKEYKTFEAYHINDLVKKINELIEAFEELDESVLYLLNEMSSHHQSLRNLNNRPI
jgi:hypothetical protein